MLLPSALACDSSQPSRPRLLQPSFFASPPASPPQLSTQNTIGNLIDSCRNLQAFISAPLSVEHNSPPTTPTITHAQLPTPPLAHTPLTKPKMRVRSRKHEANNSATLSVPATPRKKIVRRKPSRVGVNKRRRTDTDELAECGDGALHDVEFQADGINMSEAQGLPHTPKRARIAPLALPLGLNRSDYHSLYEGGSVFPGDSTEKGTDIDVESDGVEWSIEDDHKLLELFLEKLNLADFDLEACARVIGKDVDSLDRRWRSLKASGSIKIKRSRVSSSWPRRKHDLGQSG